MLEAPDRKTTHNQNSTNGKDSMTVSDEKHFTADEICQIVKVCGENGATLFKAGNIQIEFGRQASLSDDQPSHRQASPEEQQITELQAEQLAAFHLAQENQEYEDEVIANLVLTDPAEHEDMMARGDIVDEETHTS